jgi:hypothetical protein
MGIFVVTTGTPGLLPKSMRLMSATSCCSSEAEPSSLLRMTQRVTLPVGAIVILITSLPYKLSSLRNSRL